MPVSDNAPALAESPLAPLPELSGKTNRSGTGSTAKNDLLARVAFATTVSGASGVSVGIVVIAFADHLFPQRMVRGIIAAIAVAALLLGIPALAIGFSLGVLRHKTRSGRFALLSLLLPVGTFFIAVFVEVFLFGWHV